MFIVTNHLIVSTLLKNEETELPLLVNSILFPFYLGVVKIVAYYDKKIEIYNYLIGENFVRENYSSPEKYFVTFPRRKFSELYLRVTIFLTFLFKVGENRRFIIDYLYSLCKRGTTY